MNNPENNNNKQFSNNIDNNQNNYGNNNRNPQGYSNGSGQLSNSESNVFFHLMLNVISRTKRIATAYIACFPIALVFFTVTISGLFAVLMSSTYGDINPGAFLGASILLLIIFIILAIVMEVLGIVLIIATNELKEYVKGADSLWILFLIGIFIPIVSFIAGIMTIVVCKKYLI